jgi:plasmid stabilization system protein ParE
MTIQYRPAAIADIRNTSEYIEKTLKNPSAAASFRKNMLHHISLLRKNPKMGVPLSSKYDNFQTDIRFLVVNHQMVFYEPFHDHIEIIRVLDGRTDYMTRLF